MEMIWIWLAVVSISLIVEFITMDLTSIWFSLAGLIALILSAIGGVAWEIQLIVFIILSALLIVFVRKIAKQVLSKSKEDTKTNVDSLVGKRTKLLSPITTDEKGTISINGVVWNVISNNGEEIEEGKVVEVTEVSGNKLIVRKLRNALEKEESQESEKLPQEEN